MNNQQYIQSNIKLSMSCHTSHQSLSLCGVLVN